MFFIALIAFINTAMMSLLLAQELYENGLGTDAEGRITNAWLVLGFGCTAVLLVYDLARAMG